MTPFKLYGGDANPIPTTSAEIRMATEERVYRMHVVTDQGNGGAYCSKCGHNLTSGAQFGADPPIYPCPGCGAEWEDTDISGYGFGGSDF